MSGTGLIPADRMSQIVEMDNVRKQCCTDIKAAREALNELLVMMTTARATQRLRELLTPELMADVRALANSQLGFDTDRDPKKRNQDGTFPTPYDDETLRDCTIVALVSGAKIVGKEFAILGGNTYLTKSYYERKCREFPGVSKFDPRIGPPEFVTLGDHMIARMTSVAYWIQDGQKQAVRFGQVKSEDGKTIVADERISVRVNKRGNDDAVMGKAMRKLCYRVYQQLVGSLVEGSEDEPDGIEEAEVVKRETERPEQTDATQPPAAPSPGPASTATPGGNGTESKSLAGVAEALSKCDEINQANRVVNAAKREHELTPDELLQLEVWYGQTVERIREARGERANKK